MSESKMRTSWDQIIFDELNEDEHRKVLGIIQSYVEEVKNGTFIRKKAIAANMAYRRLCVSNEEEAYIQSVAITEKFCQEISFEEKIKNSNDIISEYANSWRVFESKLSKIDALFNYSDRNYVHNADKEEHRVPIDDPKEKMITPLKMLTKFWKTVAINLMDELSEGVLRYIDSERKAPAANTKSEAIRTIIESINKLENWENDEKSQIKQIYNSIERSVIKQIEEYYEPKSSEDFRSMTLQEYLIMCDDILRREEKLLKDIGLLERSKSLTTVVWNKLVYDHLKPIAERTMNCIKCQEFENVKIAYTSLKYSTDAMKEINAELEAREETIFSKFREISDAVTFCESFMTTFNEEQNLLKLCFDSNRGSLAALDKGISKALNMSKEDKETKSKSSSDVSRVPEILVEYSDKLMKTGIRGLDEKETEKKVDDVITIFQYIEDKDVFIQLYAKRLSKRLIQSLSESKEAEEMMINKMKMKCGNQFVAKVEKMVTDVELSKDITSKFNEINTSPVTFSILVTQTGSWPIPAFKSAIIVPMELCDLLTSFNKHYSETHTGRKLQWHHVLSTCDVKLNYLSRSCTVQTTVTITAILVQFNSVDSVTFEELKISTGIDKKNLLKLLQYLSTQNILSNDGDKVTEESTFSLNYKYESKRSRMKLIPVLREATEETNEATKAAVEERKFYLQALIVRIMKSKKTLSHKDLANEVIQESISSFVPSQVFIKGVIDGLIHKEYLARAEGEGDVYNYLA